jgi:sugar/nucleoside kinase (ribokinase family)
MRCLRIDSNSPYRQLIGIGGIGTGIFFELEGKRTLGRNESRLGRLLDVRDYCKLHIVIHYVAKLLGANTGGNPFRVLPIAKVGDDAIAQRLIAEMSGAGIDTTRVATVAGAPTLFSVCFQYPDGTGGNITTSNSAAAQLSRSDLDAVADLFRSQTGHVMALAVPEVPLEVRHDFLRLASESGGFCAGSFAAGEARLARDAGMLALMDLVSLNESEAEEVIGCNFHPDSPELYAESWQELLRGWYPELSVIVTTGKLGAIGITAQSYRFYPAPSVSVGSTAGAGDALLGGTLAGLAAGMPFLGSETSSGANLIDCALQLGVLLGSFKCQSAHTIHPDASLDALIAFAQRTDASFGAQVSSLFTSA